MGNLGIKRRRILRRFQKYKHAFVTKCTYYKFFQENRRFGRKNLRRPKYACFLKCILSQLNFLKYTQNSASFDTHKPCLTLLYCMAQKVYTCAEAFSSFHKEMNIQQPDFVSNSNMDSP
jgi:hypothetical protein